MKFLALVLLLAVSIDAGPLSRQHDVSDDVQVLTVNNIEENEGTETPVLRALPVHDDDESMVTGRSDLIVTELPQDDDAAMTEASVLEPEEEFWSSLLTETHDKPKTSNIIVKRDIAEDLTTIMPSLRDDLITEMYPEAPVEENEIVKKMSRTMLHNHKNEVADHMEIDETTDIPVARLEELSTATEVPIEENEIVDKASRSQLEINNQEHTHEHEHVQEQEEAVVETTEMSASLRNEELNTEVPVEENEIVPKLSKTLLETRHHNNEVHEEIIEATEIPVLERQEELNTEIPIEHTHEHTHGDITHTHVHVLSDHEHNHVHARSDLEPALEIIETVTDSIQQDDADIMTEASVAEEDIVEKLSKSALEISAVELKEEFSETTDVYETVTNSFRQESLNTDVPTENNDEKMVEEKSDYWLNMREDQTVAQENTIDDIVDTVTSGPVEDSNDENKLRSDIVEEEEVIAAEVITLGTTDVDEEINELRNEVIQVEGTESPASIEDIKLVDIVDVRADTEIVEDVTTDVALNEETISVVELSNNSIQDIPTEAEITGLAQHPANSRISAQMAHLARKYGLRPLTIKNNNEEVEERKRLRNERMNRRVFMRKYKLRPAFV